VNANEQLDFYNPDSIYYGNSRHYIQQLEAKVRQQQAELDRAVELYTDKAIENEALRMMLANRNDVIDKLDLK